MVEDESHAMAERLGSAKSHVSCLRKARREADEDCHVCEGDGGLGSIEGGKDIVICHHQVEGSEGSRTFCTVLERKKQKVSDSGLPGKQCIAQL